MTKSPLNSLDHCVRNLKSISRKLSSKTPQQIADLYLAGIGLLCHLKQDQTVLVEASQKGDQAQCPPPKDIPAITAVLQDPALFDALISCLRVGSGGAATGDFSVTTTTNSHGHGHHHHYHHLGLSKSSINSRKRTNSVTSEDAHASKAIKLSHSPTPSAARLFGHGRNHVEANTNNEFSPTMNVRILAAIILYTSFAHLDHWPVPLAKAYAEDCFGPRHWVDDEKCKCLVENLQLLHLKPPNNNNKEEDGDVEMPDASILEDAARVADSYSRIADLLGAEEHQETSTTTSTSNNAQLSPVQQHPAVRRGSLSSVGSGGPNTTGGGLKKSNSREETDSAIVVIGNGTKREITVPKIKTKNKSKKRTADGKEKKKKSTGEDDGASSSSGEEDEEVIVSTKSAGDDATASPKKQPLEPPERQGSPTESQLSSEMGKGGNRSPVPPKHTLYPLTQKTLNLVKVRRRYFGFNQDAAQGAISSSLAERLDAKAKQNSALLQCLHNFTSIAGVRSLIAGNLEKWLQSPGLSGLARTLFTSTVTSIENIDPPIPADLEAIRKILSMRLKANQLSAHIENITAIANTIPNAVVARKIYHQLLSEVLATLGSGADASASDRLKMVGAVYSALPKDISADAIAASLLMLISESSGPDAKEMKKRDRNQVIKNLKRLLLLIAQQLGASFDTCKLLESLLSCKTEDQAWTLQNEEDRARLMFQCVLLLVPSSSKDATTRKATKKGPILPDPDDAKALETKLAKARKLLLKWFCDEYGPNYASRGQEMKEGDIGAGTPDYRSVLGGAQDQKRYPAWLQIARCLLFMEDADSVLIQQFFRGDGGKAIVDSDVTWHEEKYRIDRCHEYGCDFDDEMMWIVLKSASQEEGGIDSHMALTLLEHLFECCNVHRRGSLKLGDIMLAWELYSLVCYEPPETVQMLRTEVGSQNEASGSKFDDAEEADGGALDTVEVSTEDLDLPGLAYPGMWWRVTILALVMCGVSPEQIGAPVWEEHPTLRAMIKMVISSRYRFPTVDCNEADRADMKKSEQLMREEEAKIAELLFLPPKPRAKTEPEDGKQHSGGNRISARQQQKRERAQRKRREKEAADALAEENKRKKILRVAQKTILLWDPTGPARKPPREAAELLVAVEAHFSLSKIFQRHVEPDFLLMTIGKATRGAIERAYDWLIPIISDIPDTIARLHASASCVLLLKAYGTEGDEKAQLKQLSAPLLRHVSDSITGKFGEADAVRAFDLLMSDVASHNADRRRCARRVLFDSIGKLPVPEAEEAGKAEEARKKSPWMLNILKLDHAKSLVGDAIKHMSTAIAYERGLTLRNILMALNHLISFANSNDVDDTLDFATVFIRLISSRPSVCAESLDRFTDLRTLGVGTVYQEFQKCFKDSNGIDPAKGVKIHLYPPCEKEEALLSLPLLQAASVLLSIWTEQEDIAVTSEGKNNPAASDAAEAASCVAKLANMLLRPITSEEKHVGEDSKEKGLASAVMVDTGKSAVSVESWVMLAKARSNQIARRAALTAPTGFLPRLLLCSGLPRASLLTMIDRLGKMGDASNEKDAVFSRLLIPSASSEWDIGRLGHRRDVARKLLGRLSAYLRMNSVSLSSQDPEISTSFLKWLSQECSANEKPKKAKAKAKSKAVHQGLSTLADASCILASITEGSQTEYIDFLGNEAEESCELDRFRPCVASNAMQGQIDAANDVDPRAQIKKAFDENQPDRLESILQKQLGDEAKGEPEAPKKLSELATITLDTFLKLEHKQDSVSRIVVALVPRLSRFVGTPELWQLIFLKHDGDVEQGLDSLFCRCIALWCPSHLSACYEWLLSSSFKAKDPKKISTPRVTRFLVLTSGQQSVHVDGFSTHVTVKCIENWGKSEDFVSACVGFALEGMKDATASGFHASLVSRNDLPDWLVLVLALAKCGRIQMKYICEIVLKHISQPSEDLSLPLLRAVFLRLYVSNPQGMNLGTSLIRSVLMAAAEEYSVDWLDWRSPLDDQLQDMLDTVMSGSGQRLVRPLADISKKHPLLILRKSHVITRFLETDASIGGMGSQDSRGVVHAESMTGPLIAVMSGTPVKVKVRHWGFSFTEFIWVALLDILCSIPGPVLFSCGLNMGFTEFLNVNMRLMYVQSQLKRNERDARLKDKLKEILVTFRKNSRPGWEKWMESTNHGLPTLGAMRNVMICCDFFSPKDLQ